MKAAHGSVFKYGDNVDHSGKIFEFFRSERTCHTLYGRYR